MEGAEVSFRNNLDKSYLPLTLSPPNLDWGSFKGQRSVRVCVKVYKTEFPPLAAPVPSPTATASGISWPPSGQGVLECAQNSDRGSSLVRLNWCDLMAFLADSDLYGFLSCKSAF